MIHHQTIIEEILRHIQRHYLIGMPIVDYNSNQKSKLRDIYLSEKFQYLENDTKPEHWEDCFTEIKEKVNRSTVTNYGHIFPNLGFTINYENNIENERFNSSKKTEVFVSLLAPYFTVYFSDRIILKGYKRPYGSSTPLIKSIFYGFGNVNEKEKEDLDKIIQIIQRHFSGYQFIPHHLAFRHKIKGGIPFGEDIELLKEEYSIFDFIFGSDNILEKDVLD